MYIILTLVFKRGVDNIFVFAYVHMKNIWKERGNLLDGGGGGRDFLLYVFKYLLISEPYKYNIQNILFLEGIIITGCR